ncbi:MAG: dihydrofolate reductase family protein [Thermoleophilia bacterium]
MPAGHAGGEPSLEGDALQAVAKLSQGEGGPILVAGSCTLVHALLTARLGDELRLMVFPLALGSRLRWSPETPRIVLAHAGSQTIASGVVVHSYRAT